MYWVITSSIVLESIVSVSFIWIQHFFQGSNFLLVLGLLFDFSKSELDTTQSVGLLRTSDASVAETST